MRSWSRTCSWTTPSYFEGSDEIEHPDYAGSLHPASRQHRDVQPGLYRPKYRRLDRRTAATPPTAQVPVAKEKLGNRITDQYLSVLSEPSRPDRRLLLLGAIEATMLLLTSWPCL